MNTRFIVSTWGLILLSIALWSWIGPSQIGGPLSLVVTRGTSMAPTIEAGDLVLVRRTTLISPGDVILYRSKETGQDVLHRVVRLHGDRYITQGDNNDWLDEDRVTAAEVRGVYWQRIPGAGEWVSRLRSPLASGVAGGVLIGLLGMSMVEPTERRRVPLRARALGPDSPLATDATAFAVSLKADTLMGVFVASALTGALLIGWSFGQPATTTGIHAVTYAHTADWSYSAAETARPDGAGADSLLTGEVSTGQPIFPTLTPMVEQRLQYRFNAPAFDDVRGRARMYTVLREDVSGWHTEFELLPWQEFEGRQVVLAARADVASAEIALREFERTSRLGNTLFRALVVAEVEVEATHTEDDVTHLVTDFYRPFLMFRLQGTNMIRVESDLPVTSAEVIAAGIDPLGPLFHQTEEREHLGQVEVGRSVGILAWDPTVSDLRIASVVILLLALGGVGALFALRSWAERHEPWFIILARYGHRLVFAPEAPEDSYGRGYVELGSFEDILALADARYQPIVCVETESEVDFYVLDLPNEVYRYRLARAVSAGNGTPDETPAT